MESKEEKNSKKEEVGSFFAGGKSAQTNSFDTRDTILDENPGTTRERFRTELLLPVHVTSR